MIASTRTTSKKYVHFLYHHIYVVCRENKIRLGKLIKMNQCQIKSLQITLPWDYLGNNLQRNGKDGMPLTDWRFALPDTFFFWCNFMNHSTIGGRFTSYHNILNIPHTKYLKAVFKYQVSLLKCHFSLVLPPNNHKESQLKQLKWNLNVFYGNICLFAVPCNCRNICSKKNILLLMRRVSHNRLTTMLP